MHTYEKAPSWSRSWPQTRHPRVLSCLCTRFIAPRRRPASPDGGLSIGLSRDPRPQHQRLCVAANASLENRRLARKHAREGLRLANAAEDGLWRDSFGGFLKTCQSGT